MSTSNTSRRRRQRGGSALEMALMMPWYIFLFVGAFDWGYYAHALISTESAARVAATYTSTSSTTAGDSTGACTYALAELRIVPNIGTNLTTCTASPVVVTASSITAANSIDGLAAATRVTVQYTTLQLIPIPGVLGNQFTFTRSVQMRLRS